MKKIICAAAATVLASCGGGGGGAAEAAEARAVAAAMLRQVDQLTQRLQESRDGSALSRALSLYLLLDTNGYPISWAEIREILRATGDALGAQPVELSAHIVTPDMESSNRRAAAAAALAKALRKGGESRQIAQQDAAELADGPLHVRSGAVSPPEGSGRS
ncbi:MAG: hypothetical protein RIQ53_2628 [Pseudomonadota bacterium]|jgi:hypothetical protein